MKYHQVHLTQEQAEERLAHWQKILRLEHWDVAIHVVRASAMDPGNQASIGWTPEKRMARIKLADPIDWPPGTDEAFPQDMENSIVHELLHIHFRDVEKKSEEPSDERTEQVIHVIACALVDLDRKVACARINAEDQEVQCVDRSGSEPRSRFPSGWWATTPPFS